MLRLKASMILCTAAVFVIFVAAIGCDAHRIQVDDLEVAASGKQEHWEKGGEAGHHESGHGEKGEKGEKGYESKHGYVLFLFVWILFTIHTLVVNESSFEI